MAIGAAAISCLRRLLQGPRHPAAGAHTGQAASGAAWTEIPAVTVLSAPADRRLPLVRDAAAFWNRTFAELGSGFRLGQVAAAEGALPAGELARLSEATLQRSSPVPLPDSLRTMPGNIVVALSDGKFISFSRRWLEASKALVAIKNGDSYPLTLPNVARNVIAHELGHAIGLGHNSDPAMLMCGRPAPCRPDGFASPSEHFFPLTADERTLLLRLYPPDWRPR